MKARKRILITGATSGIGKAAALKLAAQGHEVIIHGRNPAKVEAARQDIAAAVPGAAVDVLIADFTKKADVLAMAEVVNARYESLDVLVNNAGGVMNKKRELTTDGWEKTITINVLVPFMLSSLLYPKLQKQPGARIVNTASMAHRMAKPNPDDLMYEKNYRAMRAYGDAKLYVILMGQEFTRRQRVLGRGQVAMNAFHPGVVATNFAGESDSFYHFFFKAFRKLLTTPEKGADTMVYLAADAGADQFGGEYLVRRKPAKVYLPKEPIGLAGKLWEKWEHYTGMKFL